MRTHGRRRKIFLAVCYLILTLFALLTVYPLFFALQSSLKTDMDYTEHKLSMPSPFVLQNFIKVLIKMRMLKYLGNTLISVGIAMALYMFVCNAAGFAFGKLKFPGRLVLFTMVLFLQIFPQMVISGQIYQLVSKMRLLNSFPGIILIWVAYFAPFGTYIMTTYYSSVPKEIVESARIDGANAFQQLIRIMMPIAKPMLGTIGIIGALAMWNELPFSMLILQKADIRTLTLGIALMQGEYGLPVPTLSAAILVAACVPLVLYFVFQNFVTMGATAGSVKG